jgi:hypothetical protein
MPIYAHTRYLTLDELKKAAPLLIVWDKYGNKFFKLADGSWASDTLTLHTSEHLAKKNRVKLY